MKAARCLVLPRSLSLRSENIEIGVCMFFHITWKTLFRTIVVLLIACAVVYRVTSVYRGSSDTPFINEKAGSVPSTKSPLLSEDSGRKSQAAEQSRGDAPSQNANGKPRKSKLTDLEDLLSK